MAVTDLPGARSVANRAAGIEAGAELRGSWHGGSDDRAWEAVAALSRAADELESAGLLLTRLDESVRAYSAVL
ncbi:MULTISPECIES: hypothetical protein [Actinoalloteichus]|nr:MULTISPECIES: hypothetical protein [Actinoalloteichus]